MRNFFKKRNLPEVILAGGVTQLLYEQYLKEGEEMRAVALLIHQQRYGHQTLAEYQARDLAIKNKYLDDWRAFLDGRLELPPLPINKGENDPMMWEEMARPLVAISHRRQVQTDETIAREIYPNHSDTVIQWLASTARCELAAGKLHVKYAEGIPA
jgi:hypothetical protein